MTIYNCLHCGNEFEGRSDQYYCNKPCRKAEEKRRARYESLLRSQERLQRAEIEARACGDVADMRICINRREREAKEIAALQQWFGILPKPSPQHSTQPAGLNDTAITASETSRKSEPGSTPVPRFIPQPAHTLRIGTGARNDSRKRNLAN